MGSLLVRKINYLLPKKSPEFFRAFFYVSSANNRNDFPLDNLTGILLRVLKGYIVVMIVPDYFFSTLPTQGTLRDFQKTPKTMINGECLCLLKGHKDGEGRR
jgi:hypothetical protein